VQID